MRLIDDLDFMVSSLIIITDLYSYFFLEKRSGCFFMSGFRIIYIDKILAFLQKRKWPISHLANTFKSTKK